METEIIKVDTDIETICCDGGEDGLGHPAVYYTFDQNTEIVWGYCGKVYKKKNRNKRIICTKIAGVLKGFVQCAANNIMT